MFPFTNEYKTYWNNNLNELKNGNLEINEEEKCEILSLAKNFLQFYQVFLLKIVKRIKHRATINRYKQLHIN